MIVISEGKDTKKTQKRERESRERALKTEKAQVNFSFIKMLLTTNL